MIRDELSNDFWIGSQGALPKDGDRRAAASTEGARLAGSLCRRGLTSYPSVSPTSVLLPHGWCCYSALGLLMIV